MNPILSMGVEWIGWLQQMRNPFWDAFFLGVTELGSHKVYMLIIPLVLFLHEPKAALRLTLGLLLCGSIGELFKEAIAQPRPYVFVPELAVTTHHGYGLPSGHSSTGLLVWGFLMTIGPRRLWWQLPLVAIIALIGLSRLYLGVHFPSDVIAGFALGAMMLAWTRQCDLGSFYVVSATVLGVGTFVLSLIGPNPTLVMALGALAGGVVVLMSEWNRASRPYSANGKLAGIVSSWSVMLAVMVGFKSLDVGGYYVALQYLVLMILAFSAVPRFTAYFFQKPPTVSG